VASFQSLDGRQAWTTGEMDWDAANAITFTGGRYRDACVGASGRFGLTCCWAVIANTEMTPNNAPIVDVARGIRVERLFVDFGLFETVSRAFHFIVQKKLCPPSVSKDAAPQRLCVKLCVRKLYCCEPATDKRAPAVLTVTG
jgi:hypothetical protein